MNAFSYSWNYVIFGDLITISVSLMILILLKETSVRLKGLHRMLCTSFVSLIITSIFSMTYYTSIDYLSIVGRYAVYSARGLFYISIFLLFHIIHLYIIDLSGEQNIGTKELREVSFGVFFILSVTAIAQPYLSFGFYIDENGIHEKYINDIFIYAYVFFMIYVVLLITKLWGNFTRKLRLSLILSFVLSVIVMICQVIFYQTSFTCSTFLLPLLTLFFASHGNSYDLDTGTADYSSFYPILDSIKRRNYLVISIYIEQFAEDEGSIPNYVRHDFFNFYERHTRAGIMIQYVRGRYLLIVNLNKDSLFVDRLDLLGHNLYDYIKTFNLTCKTMVIPYNDYLHDNKCFVEFIKFIERDCSINEFYKVTETDIANFKESRYILNELKGISISKNLEDDRVLVYCQPVFNVETETFDSAEVLMRLSLGNGKFYTPNAFIDLAEEYNYIHSLSLIILNKSCAYIRKLRDEGYYLKRISVNFSLMELREPTFCEDIIKIIRSHEIPFENVAIELTESRTDTDFEYVKMKINYLKQYGINFYLDDFGTGYSNFERIMELPVDVIKFDRSLLLLANRDKDAEFMVNNFSNMFKKLDYTILFEGIETEFDEEHCRDMNAEYLQGYRYSRPIPLENLRDFLTKLDASGNK